jgi:hypothetical protein
MLQLVEAITGDEKDGWHTFCSEFPNWMEEDELLI